MQFDFRGGRKELLGFTPRHDRRSVRRGVRTECQVVAEEGFRLLGEHTLDVSTTGLLLLSDANVRVGEAVILSLRLPGGVSWIDATGVIARVVRGVRRHDRGRGVGVAFDRLATFDRALLLGSLHGRPPLAPGRDLRRDYASAVIAFAAA